MEGFSHGHRMEDSLNSVSPGWPLVQAALIDSTRRKEMRLSAHHQLLITGATGRIGPHVLDALVNAGFCLRVASPEPIEEGPAVRWTRVDFMQQTNYDELLTGVDIVVHLAAEVWDQSKMEPVNVEATALLAKAAENAGVGLFIYTSTVAVYGFPSTSVIDETSPTLPTEPAALVRIPYLAEEWLKIYSITKLRGESELRQYAHRMRAIVLRLANVVSDSDINNVLNWSFSKRIWRGNRRTHQIYVKDVAAVIEFFVRGYVDNDLCELPRFDTFIVSQDDHAANTFGHLFRRYDTARGAIAGWYRVSPPTWVDRFKDRIKFRRLKIGHPAGSITYTSRKLLSMGFKYRFGIDRIQDEVIAKRMSQAH